MDVLCEVTASVQSRRKVREVCDEDSLKTKEIAAGVLSRHASGGACACRDERSGPPLHILHCTILVCEVCHCCIKQGLRTHQIALVGRCVIQQCLGRGDDLKCRVGAVGGGNDDGGGSSGVTGGSQTALLIRSPWLYDIPGMSLLAHGSPRCPLLCPGTPVELFAAKSGWQQNSGWAPVLMMPFGARRPRPPSKEKSHFQICSALLLNRARSSAVGVMCVASFAATCNNSAMLMLSLKCLSGARFHQKPPHCLVGSPREVRLSQPYLGAVRRGGSSCENVGREVKVG